VTSESIWQCRTKYFMVEIRTLWHKR